MLRSSSPAPSTRDVENAVRGMSIILQQRWRAPSGSALLALQPIDLLTVTTRQPDGMSFSHMLAAPRSRLSSSSPGNQRDRRVRRSSHNRASVPHMSDDGRGGGATATAGISPGGPVRSLRQYQ